MNEKMYKASDVIGILLEEITNAEFLRVTKRLSDIPSSVVRCEDCVFCQKFNEKYYLPKRDTLICANALYTEVHENDYCSWGERRSE